MMLEGGIGDLFEELEYIPNEPTKSLFQFPSSNLGKDDSSVECI